MATKRDWAGDAAKAVAAAHLGDLALLREWFPVGTKLEVVAITPDQYIVVRWKLECDPGMTNEAVLRFGSCSKLRADRR